MVAFIAGVPESRSDASKLKMDEDVCHDEDKHECGYQVEVKTGLGSGSMTSLALGSA